MTQDVLSILPSSMKRELARCLHDDTEEIRLRIGHAPHIVTAAGEYPSAIRQAPVQKSDLQYVLSAATNSSIYSANDKLKEGYITLSGGHRLGICGEVVIEHGEIKTICNVSSISIRIAKERMGIGFVPNCSTLILGPPGSGKTTLLRECIRMLSNTAKQRVGLVDERREIAACKDGAPQFDVGSRTDILCGCSKAQGIMMLLKCMNPNWIAVDEITSERDVDALCRSCYCGVKLIATAHAQDFADLHMRPVYQKLLNAKIFDKRILLSKNHVIIEEKHG